MEKSAMIRTVRRTVHPVDDRLKSTRMRLHLPRRRARDEPRAWTPFDGMEDADLVSPSTWPVDERRIW